MKPELLLSAVALVLSVVSLLFGHAIAPRIWNALLGNRFLIRTRFKTIQTQHGGWPGADGPGMTLYIEHRGRRTIEDARLRFEAWGADCPLRLTWGREREVKPRIVMAATRNAKSEDFTQWHTEARRLDFHISDREEVWVPFMQLRILMPDDEQGAYLWVRCLANDTRPGNARFLIRRDLLSFKRVRWYHLVHQLRLRKWRTEGWKDIRLKKWAKRVGLEDSEESPSE